MPEPEELRHCFVVGPIGSDGSEIRVAADWLLNGIIRPVLTGLGFAVRRADEIPEPGMIDSQVITSVLDADLVIADLSGHNANAFYELAIRHMAQRPIIHMIDKGTEIPFDVRLFRAIRFGTRAFEDVERAKAELTLQVAECMKPHHEIDNPVTRARGKVVLMEHATPRDRLILQSLEELALRMDSFERSERRQSPHSPRHLKYIRGSSVEQSIVTVEVMIDTGVDVDAVCEKIARAADLYGYAKYIAGRASGLLASRLIIDIPAESVDYQNLLLFMEELEGISGVSEVRGI